MPIEEKQFDVALSFAGEDRKYVEEVASNLREMGIKVFYDKYELVTLWGKNLYDHLQDVYQNKAKYTVMFISKYYAKKVWTNHERKSAQAKAFISNKEYILPVKFDETEIPGLLQTIGYINAGEYSAIELAQLIKQKVGPISRTEFFPDDPDILFKYIGAKTKKLKRETLILAKHFFDTLKLMTIEERELFFETVANSCPSDFPENIHLNLELLRRKARKSIDEIISMYSRLDCLGIKATIEQHDNEKDNICKGYKIIKIIYYNLLPEPPEPENATFIPIAIMQILGEEFCTECANRAFVNLDFSILSSLTGFPEKR